MISEDNGASAPDGSISFATKLDALFNTIHPRNRGPYSPQEVAAEIRRRGGMISHVYIWQLRTGRRSNPTKEHMESLADFFGVDPAYFFDSREADEIARDLRVMQVMKNLRVRAVAARLAELPEHNLDAVGDILERVMQALEEQGKGERPDRRPDS